MGRRLIAKLGGVAVAIVIAVVTCFVQDVADDGKCANPPEVNYPLSTSPSDDANVANLCLDLNASVDDCFDQGTATTFATKVDYTSASRTKAFKVVTIKKSGEKCANGTQPSGNKERDVLLCLGPPA